MNFETLTNKSNFYINSDILHSFFKDCCFKDSSFDDPSFEDFSSSDSLLTDEVKCEDCSEILLISCIALFDYIQM